MTKNTATITIEGKISVLSALDGGVREIDCIYIKKSAGKDKFKDIMRKAENITKIQFIPDDEFEKNITSGKTHGGIAAQVRPRKYPTFNEFMTLVNTNDKYSAVAIIEGIEDPFNYGYTVRSLYTLGIHGLAVIQRDWSFAEATILKSSTGTFDLFPIFEMDNDNKINFIEQLKNLGYTIYCIDKTAKSKSIYNAEFAQKAVLLFGGEKRGISKEFIERADDFIDIPYAKPFEHSLTIQTAASVVAYELRRSYL